MKNLQYQLSNGMWVNCDHKTEWFLNCCEKNNGILNGKIVPIFKATRPLTREEVLNVLSTNGQLRNDPSDWYSNCRYEPAPVPKVPIELVRCNCGCDVPSNSVMNASLGTSCCDCYDRLSN